MADWMKKLLRFSLSCILCMALSVPAFAVSVKVTGYDGGEIFVSDASSEETVTCDSCGGVHKVTLCRVAVGAAVTAHCDGADGNYAEVYRAVRDGSTVSVGDFLGTINFDRSGLTVTYTAAAPGLYEVMFFRADGSYWGDIILEAEGEAALAAAGTYTVKKGDTYGTVALNNYGAYSVWGEFYKANKGVKLTAGVTLVLPETLGKTARINAPAAADGETLYTVKSGDTLGAIARAAYGDAMKYKTIFERNADRLVNADTIYEGQVIVLPAK